MGGREGTRGGDRGVGKVGEGREEGKCDVWKGELRGCEGKVGEGRVGRREEGKMRGRKEAGRRWRKGELTGGEEKVEEGRFGRREDHEGIGRKERLGEGKTGTG